MVLIHNVVLSISILDGAPSTLGRLVVPLLFTSTLIAMASNLVAMASTP